ncbi:MAG TPA: hypothetical protein VNL37_01155, partial [Candidatus Polarisedimenticolia bacterium]|nr:hypothetical protein [Candidatus Polarisedimenticolia bacterium]
MNPSRFARGGILTAIGLGAMVSSAGTAVYYPPLHPYLTVQSAAYRDLDGDGDRFPDTGETGRLVLTLDNTGPGLTGVIVTLTTTDPDVDCIQSASVLAGDLSTGQSVTLGSFDPLEPGFTFKASDMLQTTSATDPARIDLCIRFTSREYTGFSDPTCFSLEADLDLPPGGGPPPLAGPDGVAGTADDGVLLEDFETDKDGDGDITVNDTFLTPTAPGVYGGTPGFYLRGSANGSGLNTVAGITCGGYAAGDPACILDPDYPMDWHVHCAPGAANCPNTESGTCVGGCSYDTPANGHFAHSGGNSMHMGAHFNATDFRLGDTTHLRTLQGFVSAPVNLTLLTDTGDPGLSYWTIVRLMDDNGVLGPNNAGQCSDCADVQVQVDQDPDPNVDDWGFWDKLVPFQNVYDHKGQAYSSASAYYCEFTPTDTGTAPPAPRFPPVHETMCFPEGLWSHCGSTIATSVTPASYNQCTGPGELDSAGRGVWVQSKFNLTPYLGLRIRIRWIGSSWVFNATSSSYYEIGSGFDRSSHDDGWWLDDITITGAITRQLSPLPDTRPSPGSTCPTDLCADADGDGYGGPSIPPCPADVPVDCDDGAPDTFPGAWEVNDGLDNECPGDPGFGLVDEITGDSVWLDPTNSYFCLGHQAGAIAFQLAVSDQKEFLKGQGQTCTLRTVSQCSTLTETPPVGEVYYYLGRSLTPYTGSWGRDSSGTERQGVCGS